MSRFVAAVLLGLTLIRPADAWSQECADETCFLIRHTDKKDVLSDFIRQFPEGSHLDAAKRRLEALRDPRPGAFPPPRMVKTLRIAPDGSVLMPPKPHREPTND